MHVNHGGWLRDENHLSWLPGNEAPLLTFCFLNRKSGHSGVPQVSTSYVALSDQAVVGEPRPWWVLIRAHGMDSVKYLKI